MLTANKTTTDSGTVTGVRSYASALVGTEIGVYLDNRNRYIIPKYVLDKVPVAGDRFEITQDLFRRILSVKINGIERYRQPRPTVSQKPKREED